MSGAAITVHDIVAKTSDLPTLSATAALVIRQTYDSEIGAAKIAETLGQDQALSIRVLRLANSAYYGLPRKVNTLTEAVVLLGMRTVRDLALVASTFPWLSRPLKGYELGPRELWRHSFAVAVGAKTIARAANLPNDGVAFTAGLLQDVGKVALSMWLEGKLAVLGNYAVREGIRFDEAERRTIGFDHAEVGAAMAETWNLPQEIIDVIRYHHEPDACPTPDRLIDAVHVADYLAASMGYGLGIDGLQYGVSEQALDRLKLRLEDLDPMTDEFVNACSAYSALLEDLVAA